MFKYIFFDNKYKLIMDVKDYISDYLEKYPFLKYVLPTFIENMKNMTNLTPNLLFCRQILFIFVCLLLNTPDEYIKLEKNDKIFLNNFITRVNENLFDQPIILEKIKNNLINLINNLEKLDLKTKISLNRQMFNIDVGFNKTMTEEKINKLQEDKQKIINEVDKITNYADYLRIFGINYDYALQLTPPPYSSLSTLSDVETTGIDKTNTTQIKIKKILGKNDPQFSGYNDLISENITAPKQNKCEKNAILPPIILKQFIVTSNMANIKKELNGLSQYINNEETQLKERNDEIFNNEKKARENINENIKSLVDTYQNLNLSLQNQTTLILDKNKFICCLILLQKIQQLKQLIPLTPDVPPKKNDISIYEQKILIYITDLMTSSKNSKEYIENKKGEYDDKNKEFTLFSQDVQKENQEYVKKLTNESEKIRRQFIEYKNIQTQNKLKLSADLNKRELVNIDEKYLMKQIDSIINSMKTIPSGLNFNINIINNIIESIQKKIQLTDEKIIEFDKNIKDILDTYKQIYAGINTLLDYHITMITLKLNVDQDILTLGQNKIKEAEKIMDKFQINILDNFIEIYPDNIFICPESIISLRGSLIKYVPEKKENDIDIVFEINNNHDIIMKINGKVIEKPFGNNFGKISMLFDLKNFRSINDFELEINCLSKITKNINKCVNYCVQNVQKIKEYIDFINDEMNIKNLVDFIETKLSNEKTNEELYINIKGYLAQYLLSALGFNAPLVDSQYNYNVIPDKEKYITNRLHITSETPNAKEIINYISQLMSMVDIPIGISNKTKKEKYQNDILIGGNFENQKESIIKNAFDHAKNIYDKINEIKKFGGKFKPEQEKEILKYIKEYVNIAKYIQNVDDILTSQKVLTSKYPNIELSLGSKQITDMQIQLGLERNKIEKIEEKIKILDEIITENLNKLSTETK